MYGLDLKSFQGLYLSCLYTKARNQKVFSEGSYFDKVFF